MELKDIADRVYYGQEKIFSDNQYASSPDLKKAIESGKLVVVEHKLESYPSFKAPSQTIMEAPEQVAPTPDPRMDTVLEVIKDLNEKITQIQKSSGQEVHAPRVDMGNAPSSVESAIQSLAIQVAGVQDYLKNRNDISSAVAEQLSRVEESVRGITVSGQGVKTVSTPGTQKSDYTEEVYVPSSFRVDDMANNIKLETKNIGLGGAVNSSLSKLRELKKVSNKDNPK